jgi:hypothetical protein
MGINLISSTRVQLTVLEVTTTLLLEDISTRPQPTQCELRCHTSSHHHLTQHLEQNSGTIQTYFNQSNKLKPTIFNSIILLHLYFEQQQL